LAHTALYATYRARLRPLPGAADLLRACKRRGLTVVLASSADEAEFKTLRAALDAEDAIDEATFAGDVESSKPAPDLVEVALDKAGVPAGQAVFIGDTVWDVHACQKAGVPCIGVLTGGVSRDELTSAGAARKQRCVIRRQLMTPGASFFVQVKKSSSLLGYLRRSAAESLILDE